MLVRLFRTNQPGVLLALLLLVPLLFLQHLTMVPPHQESSMPLYKALQALFTGTPWAYGAAVFLMVCALAIQLTVAMNQAELTDRRNHLPALLFPLLLATWAIPGALGPAFFGMPLVLWAIGRTWSIAGGGNASGALFDAGMLLGLAALFYMPFAFLLVVIWASVSVIRPFQWRDYLIPLMGFLIAFYLAWGVLQLIGITDWRPLRTIARPAPFSDPITDWRPLRTIARPAPFSDPKRIVLDGLQLAVLVPLFVVSLIRFAGHYQRGVVRQQNLRSSFLALATSLGIIIGAVLLLNGWFPPVLLAAPMAILFTFAFLGVRKAWLGECAVIVVFSLALWQQYG